MSWFFFYRLKLQDSEIFFLLDVSEGFCSLKPKKKNMKSFKANCWCQSAVEKPSIGFLCVSQSDYLVFQLLLAQK